MSSSQSKPEIQSESSPIDQVFDSSSKFYPYIKAILDAIPYGISVTDAEGNICFTNINYNDFKKANDNRQEKSFVGYPIEALTYSPIVRDVLADMKARYDCLKISRNNEPYHCDIVPLTINGELVGTLGHGREHIIERLRQENQKLINENQKLTHQVNSAYCARHTFNDFWGNCENIRKVKERALKMAHTDADILIIGESGTGKEILAQAIHNASTRANEPFVAINCATLSRELINSELFGYTDGAFTSAKKGGKPGLFEAADKGTILLDEISELDTELQAKLLRVLEERCVRRVGSSQEKPVDIRVIACSNKNLAQMVSQKTFRADLYYRLNVMCIEIPPLRERKDDIIIIARGLLSRFTKMKGEPLLFTDKAQKAFLYYPWPGNVRELRNAVEYAANMCTNDVIDVPDLPQWLWQATFVEEPTCEDSSLEEQLCHTERKIISTMLDTYGVSTSAKKEIAEKLGISLSNLYSKMKTMGLPEKP